MQPPSCQEVIQSSIKKSKKGKTSKAKQERMSLSEKQSSGRAHKHRFGVVGFSTPPNCLYCGKFITNLTYTVYQCLEPGCGYTIHPECLQDMKSKTPELASVVKNSPAAEVKPSMKPAASAPSSGSNHTHNFVAHHFNRPTYCEFCKKFLWGIGKQGLICTVSTCRYAIHEKCVKRLQQQEALKQSQHELAMMKERLSQQEQEIKCAQVAPTRPDDTYELRPEEITLGKLIGTGGFGEVYVGKLHGLDVAVKKLLVNPTMVEEKMLQDFHHELGIMKKLHHPHVVLLIGACTKDVSNLLIVTEYAANGSLGDLIRRQRLSFAQQFKVAKETALGMNWLHHQNPPVIHRDLKPANILIDATFTAKVADFGISQVFDPKHAGPCIGSPIYMAPECLLRKPYNITSDVYSFGYVMWEMLTREEPFRNEFHSFEELVEAICFDCHRPHIPSLTPPSLAAFINACWSDDPQARPSFQQIVDQGFEYLLEEARHSGWQ